MKPVRFVVGRLILLIDWITSPTPMKRSDEEQAKVNAQTYNMALYQFKTCPFCVKVRRAMKKLNLAIDLRDAKAKGKHQDDLLANGGKVKVPCLRIQEDGKDTWMYESTDIVNYLEKRFA